MQPARLPKSRNVKVNSRKVIMLRNLSFILAVSTVAVTGPIVKAESLATGTPLQWWLTTASLDHQLDPQPALSLASGDRPQDVQNLIVVDDQRTYQTILGLGSSLEHSTCFNLSQLAPDQRAEVLKRLFDPQHGIGINLARICIGTPDFTNRPWYSYDDLPAGEKDPELKKFSIQQDRDYILPVLKQALEINPELLIFASPWSPPGWMTSTDDMIGGQLLPDFYDAYARYFVRFIQAYQNEGIPIYAITVQE